MREFTIRICIIFLLFTSVKASKSNSADTREDPGTPEVPDTRVEHLKTYCGVKNWTKKMPDWLMFRTGLGLSLFFKSILGFSRFFVKPKPSKRLCLEIWNIKRQSSILCMLRLVFK